ncbi:MAG TPA: DsrE family protein [Egibacteraceae bacterium]|nr:DsrE family protein [Egibacteraceae bacterium]
MRHTVLVSRDPRWALALARAWSSAGDTVAVVLLDRAAALARPGHADADAVVEALAAGVEVSVHDDALRRRGLAARRVTEGCKTVDLDEIADLVTDGADRAVWL